MSDDKKPTLDELVARAKAKIDAMTPAQRDALYVRQRESYVRAEMAMGSDADEAEYRRRMAAGETLHDTPSGAPPPGKCEAYKAWRKGVGSSVADVWRQVQEDNAMVVSAGGKFGPSLIQPEPPPDTNTPIEIDRWWSRKFMIDMIRLTDDQGSVEYAPQPDITPHDVALLLNLAVRLLTNRQLGVPDWRSYIVQHDLQRHFKPVV